jgi:hypothetical protein
MHQGRSFAPVLVMVLFVSLCGDHAFAAEATHGPAAPATDRNNSNVDGLTQTDKKTGADDTAKPHITPWTFGPVPGWLGFAAIKNSDKKKYFWSPPHPTAAAVVFDGLEGVPGGTVFRITSKAGTSLATYEGNADVSYGCDQEGESTIALFTGPNALSEGPVWILPQGATSARPVPIKEVSLERLAPNIRPAKSRRADDAVAYNIGGRIVVVLDKTARYRMTFAAFAGEKKLVSEELKREHMADDTDDFDLRGFHGINRIQVPVPLAAFELKPERVVIVVLWVQGYEGNNFQLLEVRGDRGTLRDGPSYYYCAY